MSILLGSRILSMDNRYSLEKFDHIPPKCGKVKRVVLFPPSTTHKKKIPFKEPFEKMQPFKEKKLMTARFPAGLDTAPIFTESL